MPDRLEAFEIEPSYEREDPFGRGPRVLWGRVAALGAGLVFAFLLGWLLAPGGSPSADVTRLQQQHNEDTRTINSLEASLAAAAATQAAPTPSGGTALGGGTTSGSAPTSTASPGSDTGATGGTSGSGGSAQAAKTYIVRSGDTLSGIATRFYGRTSHDLTTAIAQANNLTDATIRPGMKLTIPPLPATPTSTATTAPGTKTTPSPKASARATASPTG
jgi:LysM repeat protein